MTERNDEEIDYARRRAVEETARADAAGLPEVAAAHRALAKLYLARCQPNVQTRPRRSTP